VTSLNKDFCARCGGPIPPERIEALPETLVCIACAREMGGSDFLLVTEPELFGKAESYKKRVGGIAATLVRKPIIPI
jgi:hypothetical protein